jgi:hypothetical protein
VNTTKKKLPILSVVFYVLAAILALYATWALINCHEYIVKLVASKQLVISGNEYSIVSYYMTNCVQYVLYAAAFLFFGRIYSHIFHNGQSSIKDTPDSEEEPSTILAPNEVVEPEEKDDFSGWKSSP